MEGDRSDNGLTAATPFVDRPLVYLAGPYSHPDPVANSAAAIRIAGQLADEGRITPVVPHLTLMWHLIEQRDIEWWYSYDLALLARCDGALRIPGPSAGADAEMQFAADHGIACFTSTQELTEWLDQ